MSPIDLGNGVVDHGVATPVSNHRGTVATVDRDGRDVVLIWLFDHRGGYACLMVDALTGATTQVPVPFDPGHDCPYASVLSTGNRFYTHFNSHFVEFDPTSRSFSFCAPTTPRMAMGMTQDDAGCIWSITYPDSGLVRFDPETKELTDYGSVYAQDWAQYQRTIAADDTGWIYFAIGNTATQIIAFDPQRREATPLLSDDERAQGASAHVERDEDGAVYGIAAPDATDHWMKLYRGERHDVGTRGTARLKPIITSSQSLFHTAFPSGRLLDRCDTVEGEIEVHDPVTNERWHSVFSYTSEGAHLMGVARAPNGTLCGGTAFPMRFFQYDPDADQWTNRASHGQWNTVGASQDRFYVGGYTGGFLLEWDPASPWVPTDPEQTDTNPRFLTQTAPAINRPHQLLVHDNGRDLLLAGTPGYGLTGGGLLFWDRQTGSRLLREHGELLQHHSIMSMVALDGDRILAGTTTAPGTGGATIATEAEFLELDLASKGVAWHAPVLPGAREITDLHRTTDGRILGIADRTRFFVYDPQTRSILREHDTTDTLGPSAYHQGPRLFLSRGDEVLVLYERGLARVGAPPDEAPQLVCPSPVPIQCGGALAGDRVWFGSGSHLYSIDLKGLDA